MNTAGTPTKQFMRPRSARTLWVLGALVLLLCAGFGALGTWQVARLQWKTELIARVDARVHTAPVPAPAPERWPHISAASDAYRRVQISGTFLPDKSARVQAVTNLGSGYWVITPLRTERGFLVLVNRGFIPAGTTLDAVATPVEPVTISGLLRITEPGGAFLRNNDPAADRWTSRDVHAIAAARGLDKVAPYFIDAANTPSTTSPGIAPVAGLTVVAFHNNHLVYALTWYALALMVAGAAVWVARDERRLRHAAMAERNHRQREEEAWKECSTPASKP